jgi:aminoglycoside phosphotransferase (APT) family kinase protein
MISQLTDITPAWLSERLRACGALEQGAVATIAVDPTVRGGMVSEAARLLLSYTPEAPGERPPSLIVKWSRPDTHPENRATGLREVAFYQLAADAPLPAPRCYHAAADAGGAAHLLLQDLGVTHTQRPLPIALSPDHARGAAQALARLHAAWWNHPRLGVDVGERLTPEAAGQSTQRLLASFPAFVDFLGDALLPPQRAAYERILSSDFLQRRARRLLALDTVTLIHGDAHTGNLMLPRAPDDEVLLIDWQRWAIDVPLYDLAFLMALHWSSERRAALERPVLEAYHAALCAAGVAGYGWEACWRDYREAVLVMALIPIGQRRRGSPAGVIWYGTEHSLAAVADLGCLELL